MLRNTLPAAFAVLVCFFFSSQIYAEFSAAEVIAAEVNAAEVNAAESDAIEFNAYARSSKSLKHSLNYMSKFLSSEEDPDQDGDAKGYNYFPRERKATGKKIFIFDPNYAAWAAYDKQGRRVNVGKASGGKLYCPDVRRACKTVVGRFSVVRKGGAGCRSTRYPRPRGGAKMPYCMHFGNKGYAIHGSDEVPDYNASHGCIRVNPIAAKWLSRNFIEIGTTVLVLPYERSFRKAAMLGQITFDQGYEVDISN